MKDKFESKPYMHTDLVLCGATEMLTGVASSKVLVAVVLQIKSGAQQMDLS